jgi:hypothetical protein
LIDGISFVDIMMYGGGAYGSNPYGGITSTITAVVGLIVSKGISILGSILNSTILRTRNEQQSALKTVVGHAVLRTMRTDQNVLGSKADNHILP